MDPFRAKGPKSNKYTELEQLISSYYQALLKKRPNQVDRFRYSIRKHVLTSGVSNEDIESEIGTKQTVNNNNNNSSSNNNSKDNHQRNPSKLFARIGHDLPTIRNVEDTLRGKLWKCLLGVDKLEPGKYQNYISKGPNKKQYYKIRGDTKRTFLTSISYKSRVSEERLVRLLNSYVNKSNNNYYVQSMDAIAGQLLHVMPELDAFHTFCMIVDHHCPLYFNSDLKNTKNSLIGAFAGSILAYEVLQLYDYELFNHLKLLHPYQYLYPVIQSSQCLSPNFDEVQKLWDFLFAFGLYLNPLLTIAQVINQRGIILELTPNKLAQTLLGQRKWMSGKLHANNVIKTTMDIVSKLKGILNNSKKDNTYNKVKELWSDLLLHTTDYNVALRLKQKGTKMMTGQNISNTSSRNNVNNSKSNNNNNNINSINNNNFKINGMNSNRNNKKNNNNKNNKNNNNNKNSNVGDSDSDDEWANISINFSQN